MSIIESWRGMTLLALVQSLPHLGLSRRLGAEYWRTKAPLKDIFFYGSSAPLRATDREEVEQIKRGQILTYPEFPRVDLGMPPLWSGEQVKDPTWDFYRHCLRWTEPLLRVWVADDDHKALELWLRIVRDWAAVNMPSPGSTKFAWFDHAGANRLRLLCWAWELYRRRDTFEESTAKELLGLIYVHARFMSDPETYPGHSNHGLEMTGALLSAAVTVAEFDEAPAWVELSMARLLAYVGQNFCPQGFHLEQSPFYHFYVLDRLSRTVSFLSNVGVGVPAEVWSVLERIERVGSYLVKPDGLLPTVGDSPSMRPTYQPLRRPGAAVSVDTSVPQSSSALSVEAGYAILRSYGGSRPSANEPDTYLLFKCNSFWSPHFHHDALSFFLFALGRDWLVDAGQFSYDEGSPERKYVRSAFAHNTLLIDDEAFEFRPLAIVDQRREPGREWLEVEHRLDRASHRRRLELSEGRTVVIRDTVTFTDSEEHKISRLFHAAPDLHVDVSSPQRILLLSPSGPSCMLEQEGELGGWSVVQGQREPRLLGWYAPSYGKFLPTSTLVHELSRVRGSVQLTTRISFTPAD